ncbi:MAG: CZB domain-containing protein [Actinomycetota bacterium]
MVEKLESSLGRSALRSFVELAKFDHLIFKFEVYKVCLGISDRRPDEFASHRNCRLGKWYYEGEGQRCYCRLEGYAALEQPHQDVHHHGREAVQLYRAGNPEAGARSVRAMEAASRRVLDCLEKIARDSEAA